MHSHIHAGMKAYMRAAMAPRCAADVTVREIAAAFGGSQRTVFKWLAHFRAEGEAALANRPSRPRWSPVTTPHREAALFMRRTFKMTGEQITEALRLAGWPRRRLHAPPGLVPPSRCGAISMSGPAK